MNPQKKSPHELLRCYEEKLSTHSWEEVSDLIHDRAVFIFSDGTFRGKKEIESAFIRTFDLIKEEKYMIKNLRTVAETSELASFEYTFHWSGLINGISRSASGRGSSVLIKTDRGWKIIQEHLGPMPENKQRV